MHERAQVTLERTARHLFAARPDLPIRDVSVWIAGTDSCSPLAAPRRAALRGRVLVLWATA